MICDQTLDLEVSKNDDNGELESNLIKLNDSKIDSSIMESECNYILTLVGPYLRKLQSLKYNNNNI